MLGRKNYRRYSSKRVQMTWVLGIREEPPEASVVGSWVRVVGKKRRNPELSIIFLLLEYCPVSWLGPQGLGGGGIVIGGMEGEERGGQINIDMVRSFHETTILKYIWHFTSKIFFLWEEGEEREGADKYWFKKIKENIVHSDRHPAAILLGTTILKYLKHFIFHNHNPDFTPKKFS